MPEQRRAGDPTLSPLILLVIGNIAFQVPKLQKAPNQIKKDI